MRIEHAGSGNSCRDLGFVFYLGESTISGIVREVCAAIWRNMRSVYLPIPTETFKGKATEFKQKLDFPNCVTAIKGKHIWIRKPFNSEFYFFCYKQKFLVVLFVGADAMIL